MDNELQKTVDVIVGVGRLAGGFLAIVGSIVCFFFLQATLDPNATIEINGIHTSNYVAKLGATIIAALFPIIGILVATLPDKILDKWVTLIVKRSNE